MSTTKDAPNLSLHFVEIVSPRVWISTGYNNVYVGDARPAAALDVDSPLTGWYDCGSIMAVAIPVAKEMFEYKQGVPKTSRKFWEVDRSAQITFNTANLTPYVEALISGETIYNTMDNTASGPTASLAAARNSITMASYCASRGFAADQYVVCASPTNASLESSFNTAVIESVSGQVMTLADAGLPVVAAKADLVKKINVVDFIDRMGVDIIRSVILFWDTYVDPSQSIKIQHMIYYPKVRNFTGAEVDMKDSAEPYEKAVTLAAQSVSMTYADGSTGYALYKKFALTY